MKIIFLISTLLLFSCSTKKKMVLGKSSAVYLQEEEGGKFLLDREAGVDKKTGHYVVKRKVTTLQEDLILERSISF